jgi:hypothetical protein
MRTKVLYAGVKNSQKIRVMVDGFGMYMRVQDIDNICTRSHRNAVTCAMASLAKDLFNGKKVSGFGSGVTVYNDKMESVRVDVQIDLA